MSDAGWIDRRVLRAPGWGRGLHRARVLLRFALPAPWRWAYLRELRRSRLFDRQFYRSTNPHLHPLFRALPERHFAVFGEAIGLRPNPDFCPRAYLALNPDLGGRRRRPSAITCAPADMSSA